MSKNKFIALALTILMPGLGYIYLGRKMLFGLLLLLAGLGDIVWRAIQPNGFEMNVFLAIAFVSYYGAILLDTYYTALELEVPTMKSPDTPKQHDKSESGN